MKNETAELGKSLECLEKGGILLYPTDTVWGLGCDAYNKKATEKLNQLKNRSGEKSLIVLVSSAGMLQNAVNEVPDMAWELIDLSNQPLTIIYPNVADHLKHLAAADGSIGIRLIEQGWTSKLITRFRRPITSTSANFSGTPTPLSFDDIDFEIKDGADCIVDPDLNMKMTGEASRLIKLGINNEIKILR